MSPLISDILAVLSLPLLTEHVAEPREHLALRSISRYKVAPYAPVPSYPRSEKTQDFHLLLVSLFVFYVGFDFRNHAREVDAEKVNSPPFLSSLATRTRRRRVCALLNVFGLFR